MPWQRNRYGLDKNYWEFDENATYFANELVTNNEVLLDDGVRMIRLTTWIQEDSAVLHYI